MVPDNDDDNDDGCDNDNDDNDDSDNNNKAYKGGSGVTLLLIWNLAVAFLQNKNVIVCT